MDQDGDGVTVRWCRHPAGHLSSAAVLGFRPLGVYPTAALGQVAYAAPVGRRLDLCQVFRGLRAFHGLAVAYTLHNVAEQIWR